MSNSSPTINSLFFFNKQDSAKILGLLGQHMLKKPLVPVPFSILPTTSVEYTETKDVVIEPPPPINNVHESDANPSIEFISPTHQDTLFWCLYIIMYGHNDYIQVSRNYGVKELEVKKHIGDLIRANPNMLKKANIKITKAAIQEIMSELLTSVRDTSYLTMMGMLAIYKMNIIMISASGKTMVEFISDKDTEQPTYVLHKDNFGKYKLQAEPISKEQIAELKTKIFCLESYLKPLKTVSNYKVDELYAIARQVGVFDETKKYKKGDLYDELNDVLMWK
jgi:hypothetical protein